ncbi:helix-turn-helix transcriptional regulator [Bradyrhizobium sp. AUGA SZCCT0176]|uniref:helix-turn-helix transcriptional regulator n=1 Tax=Bradyrhizobium sp. AUGA SZCCT0176 TaxID=2807664 RepID=UPI00289C156B|nr:helix-turn-helix transcriptional regulator [Bradyrhizobium sp. AUGA SZCCT0176]
MDEDLLTPALIRAARALLGFDQAALAESSGISRKTISLIEVDEREKLDPRRKEVLIKLRRHLEKDMDVEFTFASGKSGEGVRLNRARKKSPNKSR